MMVVEDILFLKKTLEFLVLLFHPCKFWTKQNFIPGNPAELYDTSWEWNQILCDFLFIAPENFSYFLFNPQAFPQVISSIFLENPHPGIANFMTSLQQANYWSWDTRENNLEYFLFGISISLVAIRSSFFLFYSLATWTKLWNLLIFIQVPEFVGK